MPCTGSGCFCYLCNHNRGSLTLFHRGEQQLPFLHGVVYVTIHEAKNLPKGDCDPYVMVLLDGYRIAKTSKISSEQNPSWQERFRVDVALPTKFVVLRVVDKDLIGSDDDLGFIKFEAGKLLKETPISGTFNLCNKDDTPNGATINFDLQFRSAETLKRSIAVPEGYFPLRNNCNVTLYQDAHTPASPLFEKIKLASGKTYQPTCAFEDVHAALVGAKKFIYFTGWSVYAEVRLLRGPDEKSTLGELLKQKAKEGVRVLGMVWDEKFSTSVTPGLMGTHDEETVKYFKDTGVNVVLVPRGRDGVIFNQLVSTCYSHHQKTIIVDADGSGGDGAKRRLVAFVGGLDLTDGRWDTPSHELFKSLKTEHAGDFYNASADVRSEAGPRQPWHDIHSRIQGIAAYDVMQNFVERWQKQVSKQVDELFQPSSDEFDFNDDGALEEAEKWQVQLFRSINMDSAVFDPKNILGVSGKKGRARDDSIQHAYMHHIRRARDFIYIENQYFQGSANLWRLPETKSNHLIPIEITSKICEKIQNGERFAAYVVIPMHPEGDPASAAVQEMLHWQTNTMEMMYTKINAALRKFKPTGSATDYLNFYCLGNRDDGVPDDLSDPEPDSKEEKLRQTKRFMVYVHSKMIIVDDEVIIVGSANINQRSMGGNRDTEIAVGAYQEEYTVEKTKDLPRGGVHGFRMALWAEHMACVEEVFTNPSSKACVRFVNKLATENWKKYASKNPCNLEGHLLSYPVKIKASGRAKVPKEFRDIPDTSAPILGKRSMLIPHKLTT